MARESGTGEQALLPDDYAPWLLALKVRIQAARAQAVLAANAELVRLYHHIGTEILVRQERQSWGAKVIDRLGSRLLPNCPGSISSCC